MYAAIRRYQINPEYSDEVVRQIAEDFAPLFKAVERLIEYYVLDAGDGVFVTITICEDEAGVEEASRKATEWMKQYLATTILSQDDITDFFVKVEENLQGILYEGSSGSTHSQELQGVRELLHKEASHSSDKPSPALLSLKEVCEELGMSKSWVYRRLRSGEIPSVKLGHNYKIRREDLRRYLEDHPYRPPADEPRLTSER
jgi:excisionase family DNA binding protein